MSLWLLDVLDYLLKWFDIFLHDYYITSHFLHLFIGGLVNRASDLINAQHDFSSVKVDFLDPSLVPTNLQFQKIIFLFQFCDSLESILQIFLLRIGLICTWSHLSWQRLNLEVVLLLQTLNHTEHEPLNVLRLI